MYALPEHTYEINWTSERGDLPRDRKLFWIGSGYVLVVSVDQGWYLIDVQSGKITLISWLGEAKLVQGHILGDSGLTLDEKLVVAVNRFLKGWPDPPENDSPVSITQQPEERPYPNPDTLFRPERALEYARALWLREYDRDTRVKAWQISLNGEDVGTFISNKKPLVAFGAEICEYKWFILVDRWDNGIDVYQVSDKEMLSR